jgi:short-subunit dehydrogenase
MIIQPNSVVVITGAGSGLGRALASQLATANRSLVLADVDANALAATKTMLIAARPDCSIETVQVDVSKLVEIENLYKLVMNKFGRVDLLINCAGVAAAGACWQYSEATWRWIFDVNVMSVAFGIRTFVPQMLAQGSGHVVNIASAAGLMNIGDMAPYNASKHAVVSISETLYHDLQATSTNVRVSVACPGFFPTNIHKPSQLSEIGLNDNEREGLAKMASAVNGGKLSADDVATRILAGIAANQFYIFPHDDTAKGFCRRAERARDGSVPLNPRR